MTAAFVIRINISTTKKRWSKEQNLIQIKMEGKLSILEYTNWLIGLVGRVFTNGPGDLGSILCRVIPKTLKMVLDTSLLNTQQHKVGIKG